MGQPLTFSFLSDEALLCLQRLGITYARDVLSVRYFHNRHKLIRSVSQNYYRLLDEWTCNEAFFNSYLTAESEFEFGKSTFQSFFLLILEREIYHEVGKVLRMRTFLPTISFDTELADGGYLADILPAPESTTDPRAFVNYAETLERLSKLPAHIPPKAINMAKLILLGHTIRSASEALGLSFSYGKTIMKIFRDWAKTVVHKVNADGSPAGEEDMFNVAGLDEELNS